jgi:hypothetical protein
MLAGVMNRRGDLADVARIRDCGGRQFGGEVEGKGRGVGVEPLVAHATIVAPQHDRPHRGIP